MKTLLSLLGCSAWIALVCYGAHATPESRAGGGKPPQSKPQAQGGIVTIYSLDPRARSLCFRDGGEGLTIQNNRLVNRCSDLSYSPAGDGSLLAGIEGSRIAAIVDLGTPDELRDRYGYEDADGGGDGFASLRLQGKKILILKKNGPRDASQPLNEGDALFSRPTPSANAPLKLGHIYLVRIADSKDASYQQIVKLIVIAYRPNESVTIRWEAL